MKLLIFFISAALALCGCGRKMIPQAGTVVHDTMTITKTVVVHDTVLYAPPAAVSATIPSDGLKAPVEKKDKQARLTLTPRPNGSVDVDCNCDSAAIAAKLLDTYVKEHHQTDTVQTVVVEKKHVPGVVKILAWIGGIVLLIGVGLGIKKIWF